MERFAYRMEPSQIKALVEEVGKINTFENKIPAAPLNHWWQRNFSRAPLFLNSTRSFNIARAAREPTCEYPGYPTCMWLSQIFQVIFLWFSIISIATFSVDSKLSLLKLAIAFMKCPVIPIEWLLIERAVALWNPREVQVMAARLVTVTEWYNTTLP